MDVRKYHVVAVVGVIDEVDDRELWRALAGNGGGTGQWIGRPDAEVGGCGPILRVAAAAGVSVQPALRLGRGQVGGQLAADADQP